jgi:hypothetical protein
MTNSGPPTRPVARTASRSGKERQEERRRTQEEARRWAAELVTRFCAAPAADERSAILAKLDLPYLLDEEAALELYRVDPRLTSAFIQRHLPRGRRAEDADAAWHRLMGQAQAHGDEALYFALYRAQATADQWARDTDQLALRVDDPLLLRAELERRHPNRRRPDVGPQLAKLAQERGAHLLPYLMQHANEVWSARRRSGYPQMAELARRGAWLELWAALLGSCASATEYDREVMSLVQDQVTPEPELFKRLAALASAGTGPGGRRKPLRDDTLLALYERFPELARGPFRPQLEPSPSRPRSGLIEKAIARVDEELIDLVAARLAVRAERSGAERLLAVAATAARYLEGAAADALSLGQRAAAILARIPRRSIRNRRELMRRNPLARLLFERAGEACLATPEAAAQLLNAQDDQVCAVAVHALTSDDPRALPLARRNREQLLNSLERRLPSAVRRQGLRALDSLADGPAEAVQVLTWARALLARGDPSASLLALVARQLNRYPMLQQAGEKPVVYRRTTR